MAPPSANAGRDGRKTRSNTLRQAASAVFALTAVVPLLLFVWTLHSLGALSRLQAQVALGLALAVALLGFCIFRRLMGQMSDLIMTLGKVLDLAERAGTRAEASAPGHGIAAGVAAGAGPRATASPMPTHPRAAAGPAPPGIVAAPSAPAPPAPPPANIPAGAPAAERINVRSAEQRTVPGLGAIREVHDLSRAMVVLWRAEAARHRGQRVVISVLRSAQPIVGTLIELTDDGLLVQTEGSERLAVGFDRISSIDAEESPAQP